MPCRLLAQRSSFINSRGFLLKCKWKSADTLGHYLKRSVYVGHLPVLSGAVLTLKPGDYESASYRRLPREFSSVLFKSLFISKAFYAALLPWLYHDIGIYGTASVNRFEDGVLSTNPALFSRTRRLLISVNLQDISFRTLEDFSLRTLGQIHAIDFFCLLVTCKYEPHQDAAIERPALMEGLQPLASCLQGISHLLVELDTYRLNDYQDDILYEGVTQKEAACSLALSCYDVTVIKPRTGDESPFFIWYAKDVWIGRVSRVNTADLLQGKDQIKHLRIIRQDDLDDDYLDDVDVLSDGLMELAPNLQSLDYRRAEIVDDPDFTFTSFTALSKLAACCNLRYLKISAVLPCEHADLDLFWSTLPATLEHFDFLIQELHVLLPFYWKFRRHQPQNRTYLPRLNEFICNIPPVHEDFEHPYTLYGDWQSPGGLSEDADRIGPENLMGEMKEQYLCYKEELDDCVARFVDSLLGMLRYHDIKCAGGNNPGNGGRPLITDFFKPAR